MPRWAVYIVTAAAVVFLLLVLLSVLQGARIDL